MTQQERRMKRENELKKITKEIKKNHSGVCDHCNNDTATDIAHNIPRKKCGYAFFSHPRNLHYLCRSCHSLLDNWEIYEFAKINMMSFFFMMNFVWQCKTYDDARVLFFDRMEKFMEQSIERS